jgi:NADPH:quinone reductase-like Zn-dependent oxidoreductase
VGTVLRARSICEKADATRRLASHVLPLVVRGLVRPVIDRTYPIEEIRAAHERLESNATFGKIVLTLG